VDINNIDQLDFLPKYITTIKTADNINEDFMYLIPKHITEIVFGNYYKTYARIPSFVKKVTFG
jgi:CTP:phosphocholine cytidylyltransferase-like protein